MNIQTNLYHIQSQIPAHVLLVAVSKTKPITLIQEVYDLGIKDFGENKVQELCEKQEVLPKDIRWHFIGHLQTNKIKYLAPFVHLIHAVDSEKLLQEINNQAIKNNRPLNCLLQIKIAQEDSKFGMSYTLAQKIIQEKEKYNHIVIHGLMGMASFVADQTQIENEFLYLKQCFDNLKNKFKLTHFNTLSMGMSDDYRLAIEKGSNLVRIGSAIFGNR